MGNHSSTPYDDVFRTMVNDLPRITLKLINEMFKSTLPVKYTGNEEVVQLANEQFLPQQDGDEGQEKRITDSRIRVISENGQDIRNYHIECQSVPDGSIIVRMFEYDSQIALQDSEHSAEELSVSFPQSGVLYLRWTAATPKSLKVNINTPGGNISYEIPVVTMGDYSVDDVIEKDLYFLIPFYLFRYEDLIKSEKEKRKVDEARLQCLRDDYQRIRAYLDDSCESGSITEYEKATILRVSNNVLKSLSQHSDTVRKEVESIMGGRVLEYPEKTVLREGIAIGRKEGRVEGGNTMLFELVETGDLNPAIAANKLKVSIDQFKTSMLAAGYKFPQ